MDAWRSVTRIAVREARLKEIRQEILNSSKLQAHLADNPKVSWDCFISDLCNIKCENKIGSLFVNRRRMNFTSLQGTKWDQVGDFIAILAEFC